GAAGAIISHPGSMSEHASCAVDKKNSTQGNTRVQGAAAGNRKKIPLPPFWIPIDARNIPQRLQRLRRWVCWSWTWHGKKWDKPPKTPHGQPASSTDPKTWCSFEEALAAHEADLCTGIGFCLGKDEESGLHFSGLDLDGHFDERGRLSDGALLALRKLDTY